MHDERALTLRQIDQTRGDLDAISDDLEFIKFQLSRLPTRKEQVRNALGIIFCTAAVTMLAMLLFTGAWRFCL
jgi:hypothetical protein